MYQNEKEVGRNQADAGPGGGNPVFIDARRKTYVGAVRLSLNRLNKYEQRADIQGIYASFVAKYGVSSNEVKDIVGIAKSVDVTWIIKYVKVPEGMVGDYVTVNKREVLIEDAGIEAGVYDEKRREDLERARALEFKDVTFRIQGLPLDIEQQELTEALIKLGFRTLEKNNVRRMYENFNGHIFQNGLVLFKVACNIENRDEMVGLMGEHTIQLGGYEWKIVIQCFGFCIGCKKEGHKISECRNKNVVECFHCKETGHVKSRCPLFEAELAQRRERSTCFKCSQKGHFGRDCTNEALGWSMDPVSFPALEGNGGVVVKENEEIGGLQGIFPDGNLAIFAKNNVRTKADKRTSESPLSEMDPKKTNLNPTDDDASDMDASGLTDVYSEESKKLDVESIERDESESLVSNQT